MDMTRAQAELLARSLPGSDRIDAHFVVALASVAGVDARFRGVADWTDGDQRNVLALTGERLVHVAGVEGLPPVATAYRRSDVCRVTALEVSEPSYFAGYEWWVKRWSLALSDGTTFSITVPRSGGRQHDATLELVQSLMAECPAGPAT